MSRIFIRDSFYPVLELLIKVSYSRRQIACMKKLLDVSCQEYSFGCSMYPAPELPIKVSYNRRQTACMERTVGAICSLVLIACD